MATYTPQQYQEVQTAMQQVFALMQQPAMWSAQNVQQYLTTAYTALDAIATYIAEQGTN